MSTWKHPRALSPSPTALAWNSIPAASARAMLLTALLRCCASNMLRLRSSLPAPAPSMRLERRPRPKAGLSISLTPRTMELFSAPSLCQTIPCLHRPARREVLRQGRTPLLSYSQPAYDASCGEYAANYYCGAFGDRQRRAFDCYLCDGLDRSRSSSALLSRLIGGSYCGDAENPELSHGQLARFA